MALVPMMGDYTSSLAEARCDVGDREVRMTNNHNRSSNRGGSFAKARDWSRRLWETTRRAFVEFLKIPTFVIVGFLLLAAVMYVFDAAHIVNKEQASKAKWGGLFRDAQTTRDFLSVVAGSIITLASITLSLLLVAVQQGAASLTSLVFDQFLRRRLLEEHPKVLIQGWFKDNQSQMTVRSVVARVLDETLPETYDRVLFKEACDNLFELNVDYASSGRKWAA